MTSVIYESPYRLVKTLRDILDTAGDREATVCRELTKKFEEIKFGPLSELVDYFFQGSVKGEFIITLSGRKKGRSATGKEHVFSVGCREGETPCPTNEVRRQR